MENVGQHCSQVNCKMLDFLPFTCDVCKNVYCLHHRTYASHGCVSDTLICPICNIQLKVKPNEDPNRTFEYHYQGNRCIQVKRTLKCPVVHCKTALLLSNTITCSLCRKKTCIQHRYPNAHHCVAMKDTKQNCSAKSTVKTSLNDSFKCPICTKSFHSMEKLLLHTRYKHEVYTIFKNITMN